jgi:aryl-alcohol dehydrogenase-like predicted oxidoreductase
VTPGQLAVAWVLARGEDVVPVPGTKRRSHREEDVGAAAVQLGSDDLARLDAIAPPGVAVGGRYTDSADADGDSPGQPA